jgi:hypothetical protein
MKVNTKRLTWLFTLSLILVAPCSRVFADTIKLYETTDGLPPAADGSNLSEHGPKVLLRPNNQAVVEGYLILCESALDVNNRCPRSAVSDIVQFTNTVTPNGTDAFAELFSDGFATFDSILNDALAALNFSLREACACEGVDFTQYAALNGLSAGRPGFGGPVGDRFSYLIYSVCGNEGTGAQQEDPCSESTVPEPGTMLLLATGISLLCRKLRTKQRLA